MAPGNHLFKDSVSDGLPPALVPEAIQIPLTAFCPQKPGQAMLLSSVMEFCPSGAGRARKLSLTHRVKEPQFLSTSTKATPIKPSTFRIRFGFCRK